MAQPSHRATRRSGQSDRSPSSRKGHRSVLAIESLESRAVPAVVVSPASVSVPEGQARAVNIRLARAPTADVSFTLQSSNAAEATIDKTALTFTPVNWKTWQTVTVTGIEDLIRDGNKKLSIVTGAAVSGDVRFSNVAVRDVTVRTIDSKRLDPAMYAGDYTGTFSGRGVSGVISASVSGRTAAVALIINAPQAGLNNTEAFGTGTITDDGTFSASSSGPFSGATYRGKVMFGANNTVWFQGTWKYGSLASGSWRINRVSVPTT